MAGSPLRLYPCFVSTPHTEVKSCVRGVPNLIVVMAVVAGTGVGVLVGALLGDARTLGAVGALAGLIVGLTIAVLGPPHDKDSTIPGHPFPEQRRRARKG